MIAAPLSTPLVSTPLAVLAALTGPLGSFAQAPDVGNDVVRTLIGLLSTYFALVLGLLALWAYVIFRIVRRMTVGLDDTGLFALRSVTIAVPLAIDAVDFGLDFFGAPLAWFIANQTALKPLRGASLWEGLVPGTQLIPSMTLGWYWANHVRRDGPWPGRGDAAWTTGDDHRDFILPSDDGGTIRTDERV